MRVYDFDGTIYDGDSSVDFWRYCKKTKGYSISYLSSLMLSSILYFLGIYSKERFKSVFFSFIQSLENVEQTVCEFWLSHKGKIKSFYFEQQNVNDVIISASPDFLLSPICAELEVTMIASKVDPKTGKWLGENCYATEKVERFREMFPSADIENFYSDTLSDAPMAMLAKTAYLVKGTVMVPWAEYRPSVIEKIKRRCFSR